jgi:pyruvate dehydrogenase E1 component alpha subunit
MEKCPIKHFHAYLRENDTAKEAELDAIDKKALSEVNEAVEFALAAPEPDMAHVMDGMYVEGAVPR